MVSNTNDVLNRILVLHSRSLPQYLSYARPFTLSAKPEAEEVLAQIVADQNETVARLTELILENDGEVIEGEYPMMFTGFHDLSFDYLVRQMIVFQNRTIVELAQCVDELRLSPLAHATASEILGQAKGHLDSLTELIADAPLASLETS